MGCSRTCSERVISPEIDHTNDLSPALFRHSDEPDLLHTMTQQLKGCLRSGSGTGGRMKKVMQVTTVLAQVCVCGGLGYKLRTKHQPGMTAHFRPDKESSVDM